MKPTPISDETVVSIVSACERLSEAASRFGRADMVYNGTRVVAYAGDNAAYLKHLWERDYLFDRLGAEVKTGIGCVVPTRPRTHVAAISADKLADELLARIERDRDYHGSAITRDMIIDVAVMCGCARTDAVSG